VLSLYPSKADAIAGTNLLTTVTTNTLGRWSYTHATLTIVWVRTLDGQVYAVEDPSAAAAADATAAAALIATEHATERAYQSSTYALTKGRDVNVWDYAVVGDGVTDDTAAITAAITAAGVGGKVRFGKGILATARFKTGPLTMLDFQTWEGVSNYIGTGTGAAQVELKFTGLTGTQVGITMGTSCAINRLLLLGPGSAVGTCAGISSAYPTARLTGVSLYSWMYGVRLNSVWYARINECEFVRNSIGLDITNCYNVVIDGATRFNCIKDDGTAYGYGIYGTSACMVKVFGGAIENYGWAVRLDSTSIASFFGVYFESAAASAIGIDANTTTGTTVNLFGCEVYLSNHYALVNLTGCTNSVLNATGNFFKCTASTTPALPVAYRYSANPSADISLDGDSWAAVTLSGTIYALNAGNYPRVTVCAPASGLTQEGRTVITKRAAQTLAANGAVTIDATLGDVVVTLNANATSSTITNPTDAQVLAITWVQDATGGRTYVWPANARFAGAVAPSDTTLSARTTATFRYTAFAGRWYEISRSAAVPG
jgi:hypothetical protein